MGDGILQTQKVNIYTYWPDVEGTHIGYGWERAADVRAVVLLLIFFMVVPLLLKATFIPHDITTLVVTLGVLTIVLLGQNRLLPMKYKGYYQVDREGKPIRFLSTEPPEIIIGQKGINRKKFLQCV